MKRVSILGSTGSVGRSTVDLLLSRPDEFAVQAVTCHRNTELLAEQAVALNARLAVAAAPAARDDLARRLAGTGIAVAAGTEALLQAAALPADWIMAAVVGMAGLAPLLAAIAQGGIVAIANKEPLVAAGPLVIDAASRAGATLLPVDSEHNAIFQVFDHERPEGITRLILTASGGPFLTWPAAKMRAATPAQAVAHPTWSMGAKISVDSATMMNKALEVIEAHYLFAMSAEKIEVLIHPQSTVHSFVEYQDGSVLAQLGAPDMRTPIAHALAWPARMPTTGARLAFTKGLRLDFQPLDPAQFPAVGLAYDALRAGPAACNAFNAANEVAVAAFLAEEIGFGEIVDIVGAVLQSSSPHAKSDRLDIEQILLLDRAARERARSHITAREKIS